MQWHIGTVIKRIARLTVIWARSNEQAASTLQLCKTYGTNYTSILSRMSRAGKLFNLQELSSWKIYRDLNAVEIKNSF